MKKSKKLTFIDLFAGCGGLSEGFLQSGHFEAIAHVEWELPMVETLRHRLSTKWKHSNDEAKIGKDNKGVIWEMGEETMIELYKSKFGFKPQHFFI